MSACLRFGMLLAVFLGGCASPSIDVPSARRLSECFVRIDQLAMEAGWKPLRSAALPAGALEVRIWNVPALGPTSGIALERNGPAWSGCRATESFKKGAMPKVRTVAPRSGWNEFWAKVERLGILTLPDSSTLGEEVKFYDGGTTVVEIKRGNKYRVYHYYCAESQTWPEARQMAKIEEVVYAEFDKP